MNLYAVNVLSYLFILNDKIEFDETKAPANEWILIYYFKSKLVDHTILDLKEGTILEHPTDDPITEDLGEEPFTEDHGEGTLSSEQKSLTTTLKKTYQIKIKVSKESS